MQHFKSYFSNTLLLEYSEAFIQKLATKLANGNEAAVEDIKRFIRFFDTIRNRNNFLQYAKDNPTLFLRGGRPITDLRNVDMYSASQLEHIFDQFSVDAGKTNDDKQIPITQDADLLYPKSTTDTIREINPTAKEDPRYMEIYFAGNQEKCVQFSHDTFNQSYSFCVGRKDASNLYSKYRLGLAMGNKTTPSSFYFVRDYSLPHSNKYHLIVIQKTKENTYFVTSAINDGDVPVASWDKVVEIQPKLKGLEHLFKFVPFSEQEEDQRSLTGSFPDEFRTFSPRVRNTYILSGKPLLRPDFLALTTEEQNNYISIFTQQHPMIDADIILFASVTPWRFHAGLNQQDADRVRLLQKLDNQIEEHVLELNEISKNFETPNKKSIYTDGRPVEYAVTHFFDIIAELEFNRHYTVSNNTIVKREQERIQPLKLFINKITQNALTGDNIQNLFNKGYTEKSHIISRILNEKINTHKTIGLIKLDKHICVVFAKPGSKGKLVMTVCDSFLKPLYRLITIHDITSKGFVIQTEGEENTKLLNFKNNELHIEDVDRASANEHSLFLEPVAYDEFIKLHPSNQAKRIEHTLDNFNEIYKDIAAPEQNTYGDFTTSFPIYLPSKYDSSSIELFKNICDGYFSKKIQKELLSSKHARFDGDYFTSNFIRNIAILYFITKKHVPEKADKVLSKSKALIQNILSAESSYVTSSIVSTVNIVNNKMFFLSRMLAGSIFDLNTLTYTIISDILMFTKDQIVFGDVSKKSFDNIICYNKNTLEETDKSIVNKIKDNFNKIIKSPDENKAEAASTLFTKYYTNPDLIKHILGNQSLNNDKIPTHLPLYSSSFKIKVKPKQWFIVETKSQELQDEYNNFIPSDLYFKAFLKTIEDIYDIKLRRVIFAPAFDLYSGSRKNYYKYNIVYEYSSYEQSSITKLDTQFAIILKNTVLENKEKSSDRFSNYLMKTEPNVSNLIASKSDTENLRWHAVTTSSIVIPSRNSSSKSYSIKKFLSYLKTITSGKQSTQEYINIVARDILGTLPTLDMHIGMKQYYNELNKADKVVEDSFIPFGIFYKLKQ
jgi:hypothetical protein